MSITYGYGILLESQVFIKRSLRWSDHERTGFGKAITERWVR